jgi:hypothetical protein
VTTMPSPLPVDLCLHIGRTADVAMILWLTTAVGRNMDWNAVGVAAAHACREELLAYFDLSFDALGLVIQQGCLELLQKWKERPSWTSLTRDALPYLAAVAHHFHQRGIAYWLLGEDEPVWTATAWHRLLTAPVIDLHDFMFTAGEGNVGEPAHMLVDALNAIGGAVEYDALTVRLRLLALLEQRDDYHDILTLVATELAHPAPLLRLLLGAGILHRVPVLWPVIARHLPLQEVAAVFVAVLLHPVRETFVAWYLKTMASVSTEDVNCYLTHEWLSVLRDRANAVEIPAETMIQMEGIWLQVLSLHPEWEAGQSMLPLWPPNTETMSSSSSSISPDASMNWDYYEEDLMYVY